MDLEEAIGSIPEKKLKLQNALNALTSVAAASPFSIPNIPQWKDLEAHFAPMEASIREHLHHSKTLTLASLLASDPDGGLAELRSQLALSPDPARLVLDLTCRLLTGESEVRLIRTCVIVLAELDASDPAIDDSARARATDLALKWRAWIEDGQSLDPRQPWISLALLQLVATYGLVEELDIELDLLPALYVASRKPQAVHFVDRLGLREKLPEIIHKLSEDEHIAAVKFIYAFNLEDKFPVVPLLKGYINYIEEEAQAIREKGKYSVRSQRKANTKILCSLRLVLKLVEEHNLETEYPREVLEKGMSQLEHQSDPASQAEEEKLKLVEEHNLETENPREVLEEGISQLEHQSEPAFQAEQEKLKLVEEHNLETEHSQEVLEKGMFPLEHQLDPALQAGQEKLGNKQTAVAATASETEDQKSGKKRNAAAASQTDTHHSDDKKQPPPAASQSESSELTSKRGKSRPLTVATKRSPIPAYGYPSSVPLRAPYSGTIYPFGMAMPRTVPNYGTTMGHRGPYPHPAAPYAGPAAWYNRSVAYGGHVASGFPPYYGPPRYR